MKCSPRSTNHLVPARRNGNTQSLTQLQFDWYYVMFPDLPFQKSPTFRHPSKLSSSPSSLGHVPSVRDILALLTYISFIQSSTEHHWHQQLHESPEGSFTRHFRESRHLELTTIVHGADPISNRVSQRARTHIQVQQTWQHCFWLDFSCQCIGRSEIRPSPRRSCSSRCLRSWWGYDAFGAGCMASSGKIN